MKYLFYDCEVANSFNKISKMCSFGYVLTDDLFNIIKKEDILINPEDEFDYHVIKNKKIKLFYKPEEFKKHGNFKELYENIKKLFLDVDLVFGFSIENDIKFLLDDCARYNLEPPFFYYIDVQNIFKIFYNMPQDKSLEYCINHYHIENHLFFHKSDDDAYQTMLVLKELINESKLSLDNLIKKCNIKVLSINDYKQNVILRAEKREEKRRKYEEECNKLSRLLELYDKKINDGPLKGYEYTFLRSAASYIDEALEAQKYIYKNGGVTKRHFEKGMYIIIKNEEEINSKIPDAKFVLISDLVK